jgi:hypothetical protein
MTKLAKMLWPLPVLLTTCVLASCSRSPEGGSPPAPGQVLAPVALNSDQVAGYIFIPDLDQAIRDVVRLADAVKPGSLTAEQLKSQIGGFLGDPGLTHLDSRRPILLLVQKPQAAGAPPPLALFIPAKEGAPYGQNLQAMGLESKTTGGLLVAGQGSAGLESAEKMRPTYDALAGAKLRAGLRVYVHAGRLLDAYGGLIRTAMQGIAARVSEGQPGTPANAAAILKMEAEALLAFLSWSEELQVDLRLGEQGVDLDSVLVAKPQTKLAELFAKSAGKSPPSFGFMRSAGSTMLMSMALDGDSASALVTEILDVIGKASAESKLVGPEVVNALGDFYRDFGARGVFSMGMEEGRPFSIEGVMEVKDGVKLLAAMEKLSALFASGGAFHELYRGLGLDAKVMFKKDARTHGDAAVHRFEFSFEATADAPEPLRDSLKAMTITMSSELAIAGGWAVMSTDAARLDAMVDAVKAGEAAKAGGGPAFASVKAFGPGRQLYMDYDVLGLMKGFGQWLPGPGAELLQKLPAASPLLFAGTFDQNRGQLHMRVPLDFIQAFGKLGER